jgi:LEA14-like dessication related protein
MNSRLVLALACVGLLVSCKSLDGLVASTPKPTARVIHAELKNLSLDAIDLLFQVEINNPYPADLPMLDLAYSLSSGGSNLLQGSIQPAGSVPARGSHTILLPARIASASVLKTLKGVTPGSVITYQADLSLSVDAPLLGRLTLPLSQSGELPIPALPEVEMTSLTLGKLGLDLVSTSIKLQVKNTNQFPLALTRVNVSFALGGTEVGASNLTSPVNLPAGQATTLALALSFSPRTAGMGLLNLLRGKQIAYRLSGSLDADSRFGPLSLPFNQTGNSAVVQ